MKQCKKNNNKIYIILKDVSNGTYHEFMAAYKTLREGKIYLSGITSDYSSCGSYTLFEYDLINNKMQRIQCHE